MHRVARWLLRIAHHAPESLARKAMGDDTLPLESTGPSLQDQYGNTDPPQCRTDCVLTSDARQVKCDVGSSDHALAAALGFSMASFRYGTPISSFINRRNDKRTENAACMSKRKSAGVLK